MTPGAGPSVEGERADLRARLVSQGRVRLRGDAGVRGHWQERGTRRAERPECAGEGVRRCWAGRAEGGGARWAAGVGAGLSAGVWAGMGWFGCWAAWAEGWVWVSFLFLGFPFFSFSNNTQLYLNSNLKLEFKPYHSTRIKMHQHECNNKF